MGSVLKGLAWQVCRIYLDDVIVYSANFTDHLLHLGQVLTALRSAGLKLKSQKCRFAESSVEFLGHIVSKDGVSSDPKKIGKVRHWPSPCSTAEVQSFLGFAGYHLRFIDKYAEIAAPLTRLTQKHCRFHWADVKMLLSWN
jgi:hypothetical protein